MSKAQLADALRKALAGDLEAAQAALDRFETIEARKATNAEEAWHNRLAAARKADIMRRLCAPMPKPTRYVPGFWNQTA